MKVWKLLNRAAEDAVKKRRPFCGCRKGYYLQRCQEHLVGSGQFATQYLQGRTQTALYGRIQPGHPKLFSKVVLTRFGPTSSPNTIQLPLVNPVNPDLTDYVTNEALKGEYTMISVEEKNPYPRYLPERPIYWRKYLRYRINGDPECPAFVVAIRAQQWQQRGKVQFHWRHK